MNGIITYLGVAELIEYTGGRKCFGDKWCEIRLDRVLVPHMLHLLMVQGLPIASVFSGSIQMVKAISLNDWRLAKCSFPPIWRVPFYLRDIVLVKGDNMEGTMRACLEVHRKKKT